jgi:ABC-2 type transport system permease protein
MWASPRAFHGLAHRLSISSEAIRMKTEKTRTRETPRKGQAFKQMASRTWLIVEKEVMANLQNGRIQMTFATMTLLFLLSAHVLAIDYRNRLENWTINQAAQQDPVKGGAVTYTLPDGSFFHSAGTGHDAPLQHPEPLSVLVKGTDGEVDRTVTVSQRINIGPRQNKGGVSALFESPDISFVVKLMVSLFALVLTLGTVTYEKETGTLQAILAHPIRRGEVLLGKATGAAISLLVPFTISYLSAIIYLYSAQGLLREKDQLAKALLIFCFSLVYGLVFLNLGLLISTLTTRRKTAIVTALLVWGTVVLVLPDSAVLVANILSPTPSYNQLGARLYESQQQIIKEELRAHPGATSIFNTPSAKQALSRVLEADKQLTDDYIASKLQQIDQARSLAVISPAGALMFGLSDLAGTGTGAFGSYLEFLRSGQSMMIEAMERGWDLPPEEGGKLIQETLKTLNTRQRQSEPALAGLRLATPAIWSLVVWMLGLGLAACWRFQRYDVR